MTPSPPPIVGVPAPRVRLAPTVAVLGLVMFTVASQFLIVAPVLPRIGEVLHVSRGTLGLLVSGYAATVAVFALVSGPISDRVGRLRVLQVGSLWMGVALLLHGLAGSFLTLLLLRVVAGAGSGMMSGATVAYLGDVVPYEQRGRALGWVMAGMAFGQVVGVPAGTLLAGWFGFQAPFVVFGAVMMLAFLGTLLVLVPTTTERVESLTLAGALSTYASILGQPALLAVSVASATMMWSVSSYVVYMPTWLEDHLGATPNQVALMFLVGGLANAATGPVAGRISDAVGRKGLVVVSNLALSVLMAATTWLPSVEWAYPYFFATMLTVGARIGPLNAWMTALVPATQRGTLLALTMATGQAGFALGAAVAGWTYASGSYASNTALAAVGGVVTAMLLGAFVPEPALGPAAGRGMASETRSER